MECECIQTYYSHAFRKEHLIKVRFKGIMINQIESSLSFCHMDKCLSRPSVTWFVSDPTPSPSISAFPYFFLFIICWSANIRQDLLAFFHSLLWKVVQLSLSPISTRVLWTKQASPSSETIWRLIHSL